MLRNHVVVRPPGRVCARKCLRRTSSQNLATQNIESCRELQTIRVRYSLQVRRNREFGADDEKRDGQEGQGGETLDFLLDTSTSALAPLGFEIPEPLEEVEELL